MESTDRLSMKYDKLSSLLDERSFRLCIAADAESFGDGGVSQVATKEFISKATPPHPFPLPPGERVRIISLS